MSFEINVPPQTNVRVAFFGSPCAGKSYRAKELSENILNRHVHVREFATDLIAKKQEFLLENQTWVTKNQAKRELDAFKKSNLLITDSPVEFGEIYAPPKHLESVKKIIHETTQNYMSVNIFVKRDYSKEYETNGRIHTDEQSRQIEKNMLEMFKDKNLILIERKTSIEQITKLINKEIKRQEKLNMGFTPTKEQQKVIDFFENLDTAKLKYGDNFNISVSALAGCGKTSTLKAIAKEKDEIKFLYLVFSKEMQKDSQKSFGAENVDITTMHSFAYQNLNLTSEPLGKYNPYTIANILEIEVEKAKDVIKEINTFSSNSKIDMDDNYSLEAKRMWDMILKQDCALTHQAYLKAFYVKLKKEPLFKQEIQSKFDCIFVDESQDLNTVAVAITQAFDKPKLFVGDSNQNIFDFTGTNQNVFSYEDFFKEHFTLSQSFRSTPKVCDYANLILKHSDNKHFLKTDVTQENQIKSVAYLTRTNNTILKKLYDMIKAQLPNDENGNAINLKSIHTQEYAQLLENVRLPTIVRDLKSLFNGVETLSSLMKYVSNGTEPIIKDKNLEWLKYHIYDEQSQGRLKDVKEFMSFCRKSNDVDVKSAFNILLSCSGKNDIPLWKLKKMFEVIKNKKQFFKDQYILTAHTSKGLEYDKVVLLDDFPSIKNLQKELSDVSNEKEFKEKNQKLQDEINLYYVAITRAKYEFVDTSDNQKYFLNYQENITNSNQQTIQQSQSNQMKIGV